MANSAFGIGLGLAHEFGLALGDNVNPPMIQNAITDPVRRASVEAALCGTLTLPSVPLGQLLEREIGYLKTICDWADTDCPTEDEVAGILAKAQEDQGGILTQHARIVPSGLKILGAYGAIYRFNQQQEERRLAPLKLNWLSESWRECLSVSGEPTKLSVFHTDFTRFFAVGMNREPYGLTYNQQIAWARDQGGDGITSVTETFYLLLRCAMESNRLLWFGFSVRCRDSYGSGNSLCVLSDSAGGLNVRYYPRDKTSWDLGALPRKCTKGT